MDKTFTLQSARASDIWAEPAKRQGATFKERDISARFDFGSAPERPHQVYERAGSPLDRTGRGSPQAFLFFKRDTPALGRWKAYFYRRPKDNEVKRLRSRRTIGKNLFSSIATGQSVGA
jgi:hypothetical protein